MKKVRVDQLVFERGLTNSRERAKTAIIVGSVLVNGQCVLKPGSMVSGDAEIKLTGGELPYVSRGGLKLQKALDSFNIDPCGMICIDCGASTGGFTEVLLQRGASKVYAVDVGWGQLAKSLREDKRVVVMERTNIRNAKPEHFAEPPELAVMDLSFISLRLVLPVVRELLAPESRVICLIKPQFEAGREKVGKKGVVRGKATHVAVINDFLSYSAQAGFSALGLDYSPVKGSEGNIEYLAFLRSGGGTADLPDRLELVEAAHSGAC